MKNLAIKILTIGLTATLFAGCFTACKATATAGANAPQANQEQAANENKGEKQVMGGWTIPESTEITEEHKKIYNNAISKYDGTGRGHEPVALLATQVVAGTNYCFYCKSTTESSHGPLESMIMYINVNPSGEADIIKTDRELIPGYGEAVGGWQYAKDTSITENVKKIMSKATETLTGATYEPVVYMGSQLVSGTNHMILCKMAPSVKELNGATSYVIVTVYENLDGKCEITETKDYKLGV